MYEHSISLSDAYIYVTTTSIQTLTLPIAYLIAIATYNKPMTPPSPSPGCDIYGAVSLLAGLSAIWFLTAISVERYRKIRYGYLKTTFLQVRFAASFFSLFL